MHPLARLFFGGLINSGAIAVVYLISVPIIQMHDTPEYALASDPMTTIKMQAAVLLGFIALVSCHSRREAVIQNWWLFAFPSVALVALCTSLDSITLPHLQIVQYCLVFSVAAWLHRYSTQRLDVYSGIGNSQYVRELGDYFWLRGEVSSIFSNFLLSYLMLSGFQCHKLCVHYCKEFGVIIPLTSSILFSYGAVFLVAAGIFHHLRERKDTG